MGATNSKPMTTQDGTNLIRAARVSTGSTIELVELGIKCDELFIEKFRDYPWRNTLDINMVAILAAFFSYFLDKDETKIYAKRVLNFMVSIDHAEKTLFQLRIDGNGKAIERNFMNNQYFNELLDKVWAKNDPKRAKFWAKVKGISFWIVSKKRAEQIADAIEKLDNAVDIPSESKSEPKSESEPELESESKSEPKSKPKSKPNLDPGPEPEPKSPSMRLHLGRYEPDTAKEEFDESEDIEASRHTDVAEFLDKPKQLPYTPRPLTDFEKDVMRILFNTKNFLIDKAKDYSDIPGSVLQEIVKNNGTGFIGLKNVLDNKGKNFTKQEVQNFIRDLLRLYSGNCYLKKPILTIVEIEEQSVFSFISNSDYYKSSNQKVDDFIKKHKRDIIGSSGGNIKGSQSLYFNKNEISFFYVTAKSIAENTEKELKNRETLLKIKRRGESDFVRRHKKMKKFYNEGRFEKGNKAIHLYTCADHHQLNNVGRHSISPLEAHRDKDKEGVEDEETFYHAVLEMSEVRKRIREETEKDSRMLSERLGQETLHRGIILKNFLKTIHGNPPPKEWLTKDVFEPELYDKVTEYLKDKISIDPGILSTSKEMLTPKKFFDEETGLILNINVADFKNGMDISNISRFGHENEVILAPGTKLKITSVRKPTEEENFFVVECKAIEPKSKSSS